MATILDAAGEVSEQLSLQNAHPQAFWKENGRWQEDAKSLFR